MAKPVTSLDAVQLVEEKPAVTVNMDSLEAKLREASVSMPDRYGKRNATQEKSPADFILEYANNISLEIKKLISASKSCSDRFEREAEQIVKEINDWSSAHAEQMRKYQETAQSLANLMQSSINDLSITTEGSKPPE